MSVVAVAEWAARARQAVGTVVVAAAARPSLRGRELKLSLVVVEEAALA